jgi:hypothetical protein
MYIFISVSCYESICTVCGKVIIRYMLANFCFQRPLRAPSQGHSVIKIFTKVFRGTQLFSSLQRKSDLCILRKETVWPNSIFMYM